MFGKYILNFGSFSVIKAIKSRSSFGAADYSKDILILLKIDHNYVE